MKTLYLDCCSGISGDMSLGAMIALGADFDELRKQLKRLPVSNEFELIKTHCSKQGIEGVDIEVRTHLEGEHHHGHHHHPEGQQNPHHEHSDDHPHEHETQTHKHTNHHEHRNLNDCLRIIDAAGYSESIENNAFSIFRALAEAEAAVHGTSVDEIHFHEVGAVDAIVDIVGVCVCIEMLGVEKVLCSPMPTFYGYVDCAHGRIPLPAPAVTELLKGVPWRGVDIKGELVTPTGAAIVKTLATSFGSMPDMGYSAVGYGCGKQDFEIPNILRAYLYDISKSGTKPNEVSVIETNIDDMDPQIYEEVMDCLLDSGALDVYLTPIQMKKGRPGIKLTTVCEQKDTEKIADVVLLHSTSIGLRMRSESRMCLHREISEIETRFGKIRVKVAGSGGKTYNIKPEYSDCLQAAQNARVPVKIVYNAALAAACNIFGE